MIRRLSRLYKGPQLTRRLQGFTLLLPAVIAIILLIGFPLLWTLWLSLHRWYGSHTTPWEWMGLRNYADVILRDLYFRRSFLITGTFAALTVTGSVVLGLGIALLINRESRLQGAFLALLMVPVVSTPVAVSITWKYILQYEGALNWISSSLGLGKTAWLGVKLVLPTLVAVDITRWTPLVMLMILAGLSSLPTDPYEAAIVDGASPLQMLRYITLPLLRPFIGVAALIRLIDAIKTFDEVVVLTEGGPAGASETLYLYGYKVGFHFMTFGYVSAVLVLFFVIILMASLVVIRLRRTSW
jgi:multiple sugar transport system permease protein